MFLRLVTFKALRHHTLPAVYAVSISAPPPVTLILDLVVVGPLLAVNIVFTRATLCWRGISYCPVSVCPSQVGVQSSVKTAEQIEMVFGAEATVGLSYTVLKG